MQQRARNLRDLANTRFDVLIIGGGINGAVSAAALAAHGVRTALIEQADFASGTSSESSNLVWGGIKYLESYEFRLVAKLCKSRNQLMASYPSRVREIRFLTTIAKGFRFPVFLVYLSTLFYWVVGRFVTRRPSYYFVRQLRKREPVINTSDAQGGFEYSDCYLCENDARFVFNFVRSAMNRGCVAANYLQAVSAVRDDGEWLVQAADQVSGETFPIRAKLLINAAGPWVDGFNRRIGQRTDYRHAFSKGVHLVVERIAACQRVLAFFASDGRLFFVIPMGDKTCIGTTDTPVDTPNPEVTEADRDFILGNANKLLNVPQPLTRADIIAERCGVRPLALRGEAVAADWLNLSRSHQIEVNRDDAYLSIFGGKLTDCLNVGAEVVAHVESLGVPMTVPDNPWYGEPGAAQREAFMMQARELGLDPDSTAERLWRRYGADAAAILATIRDDPTQAEELIEDSGFLRAEAVLAADSEMVVNLDDLLRRRTLIALVIRRETLAASAGLKELCRILFGVEADKKINNYFNKNK